MIAAQKTDDSSERSRGGSCRILIGESGCSCNQVNDVGMSFSIRPLLFLSLPVLAFGLQVAVPAGTATQYETASAAQASPPDVVEGRIKLDVVVTDKSGKPVSGLDLKDFALLDNNLPAKILSFQAIDGTVRPTGTGQAADHRVEVILLLDTVNVDFQQVAAERQEIARFLRLKGGHLAQPMSVYLFAKDGVQFQSDPSADGNAVAAALNQVDGQLRAINRAQGAWGDVDRVLLSIRNLDSIAQTEENSPGLKILIWVGPGWPMLDSSRFQSSSSKGQEQLFDSIVELSNSLREAHIALYSISAGQTGSGTFLYEDFLKGVKSAQKASPSNLGLKVLAIQSGGRVLPPSNDLASEIDSCIQDANAFYTISFDPPRADKANEYHDLKVVVDKPGMKALTNTGYYN
jgi:VWFA-related protein